MLKKTMTYTDYNGNSITEDFYFNLTQAELIELELSEKAGLAKMLEEIVKSEDGKRIIETFKKIILTAYGQKSEDGRRFVKNEELRTEFSQTEAYSDLFMELATDADSAAAFVKALVPTTKVSAETVDGAIKQAQNRVFPEEVPAYVPVPSDAPAPILKKPSLPAREMTREELLQALRAKDAEAPVPEA